MAKKSKNPTAGNRKKTALQAVLFVIVLVLTILALMIVELHPVKSVPAWVGPEESLALATITAKVFAAANQKQNEICRINFSQRETNTMLAMLLGIYNSTKNDDDPPVYAIWNKGFSDTSCSIKVAGLYLNFYLQIIPSYSNGKLYVQVASCRIGKFPLPAGTVEKALNDELTEQINNDFRLQQGLALLHSLQVEKSGDIQIEVLRKNSKRLLKSLF